MDTPGCSLVSMPWIRIGTAAEALTGTGLRTGGATGDPVDTVLERARIFESSHTGTAAVSGKRHTVSMIGPNYVYECLQLIKTD